MLAERGGWADNTQYTHTHMHTHAHTHSHTHTHTHTHTHAPSPPPPPPPPLPRGQREENLLEMAFFITSHGNLQEAYDAVEGMVHISPFRENPLLRGYCALLQLILWRRERAAGECVSVSV